MTELVGGFSFSRAWPWNHCHHPMGTLEGSPSSVLKNSGGLRVQCPAPHSVLLLQESRWQGPLHDRAAPGVPDQPPVAAVPGTGRPAGTSPWVLLPRPCSAHSVCPQLPPKRDETALQEEEELQLALALSQSEAEEKERMVS